MFFDDNDFEYCGSMMRQNMVNNKQKENCVRESSLGARPICVCDLYKILCKLLFHKGQRKVNKFSAHRMGKHYDVYPLEKGVGQS